MRSRSMEWWWTNATLAFLAVLIVGYALEGAWVRLALAMAFAALLVADLRRSRARTSEVATPAQQEWTPDRVRTVTADATSEVMAVRAVRAEDPDLSLLDALQLVRSPAES